MPIPVILLAFANDKDAYLPLLKEEERIIYNDLRELEKLAKISIVNRGSADISDIITQIRDNLFDLNIFHFGGHSNSQSLLMEDQTANAQGIAQLLAQAPNLKLVFLNGCANVAQINLLRNAKVKALIIATHTPIQDDKAQIFATSFYKSLVIGMSFQNSFDFAKATLQTLGKMPINSIQMSRFLGAIETTSSMQDIPWVLDYLEENDYILQSKLYEDNLKTLEIKPLPYEANKQLIDALWLAFAPHNDKLQFKYQQAQKNAKVDIRLVRQDIIDCFPTPIGEQIRKVFSEPAFNEERLKNLAQVYRISIRLYCYTLLSQVWEEKRKNPQLNLKQDEQVLLAQFFSLNEQYYTQYNYLPLITVLVNILMENGLHPFVVEFEQLREALSPEKPFAKSILFLETLFQNRDDKIGADEIKNYCLNAEENLAIFLQNLAFTIGYTLKTIKQIEVKKRRFQIANYQHRYIVLDKITADFLEDVDNYKGFTESNSVILFRDTDNISDYLNLSPLLIDKNANLLDAEAHKPSLYFYAFRNPLNGAFYFEEVNYNDKAFLKIDNNNLPELNELLDEMINDFSI